MAGVLTVMSTQITGETGTKVIGPLIISGVGNVIAVTDISFTSAQSITVTSPVGATGAVISTPSGNSVGLTLKGVSGDTGIPVQPGQQCAAVITFATPTSANTFVLTSAAAIPSGVIEISFW